MKISKSNYLLGLLFAALLFQSCSSEKPALAVHVEPAQTLVTDQGMDDFSLVLNDMKISETEENIIYKHKYVILKPTDKELKVDSTDWMNVSEKFFQEHENDLGMELVSRHGDVVTTTPKPVGFDWAIGNEKEGEWVVDSTSTNKERRWRYRPSSFFLMYWMLGRPTSRGTYSRYSSGYKGSNKPFYGGGSNKYGTSSSYQKKNRSSFYSRRKSSSTWSNYKKTKSSSRFRGGSSTRGRSGGVGK